MLDCHCHILPAIDDGATSLEQSIAMLHAASKCGITEIVATPHIKNLPIQWSALEAAYAALIPQAEMLKIKLHLGCELYAPLLSEIGFAEASQFCIQNTNLLLIEFHPRYLPDNLTAYFNELISRNIVPVIAHPERYGAVQSTLKLLDDLAEMGCLLQINGRSITHNPFDRCSSTAKKILKRYSCAFLSSDAHRPDHYVPLFKAQQKYQRLRKELP